MSADTPVVRNSPRESEQSTGTLSVAASIDESARRQFEAARRRGELPPIANFLPPSDDPHYHATLEELVVIDLEFAWKAEPTGSGPRLEDYLNQFPCLRQRAVLLRLVQEENRIRQRHGAQVSLADYRARFPDLTLSDDELVVTSPAGDDSQAPLPAIPGYEILGMLGRGGMGMVLKARQVGLDRLVALKLMLSGGYASADERARFYAEATAVARLQHPNIVQVYEIAEHDGRPYIALEFVDGGNLAQRLAGQPQPARWAAELLETLARAAHSAHQCGIVHRDLKPANVLLSAVGSRPSAIGRKTRNAETDGVITESREPMAAKIADFGLAKRLESDTARTQTGAVLGTPSYMAPEQAAGRTRDIGPWTDVYALGAILYEVLTGGPPFRGATPAEVMSRVLSREPEPPGRSRSGIPRDLETICLKCLQKDTSRRYSSALDLAEDLRRFLEDRPIRARRVGPAEQLRRWCRRNPALASATGLAALALVAATVVSFALYLTEASNAARLGKANSAVREQSELAERRLHDARTESARLALDRGLTLCEQGEPAQGLLWLARSQEVAPDDDADCQRVVRMNLADWRHSVRPLRAIFAHKLQVNAVAFSPDGKTVLTGSGDGTACLWDAASRAAREPALVHGSPIHAVTFSPDGRTALTAGEDGAVRLWDVASGADLGRTLHHPDAVRCVTFSPDRNTILTGCQDGKARRWDATTGAAIGEPIGAKGTILSVAYNPDGRTFVTGTWSGTAQVWDVAAGKCTQELTAGGWVLAAAYSPDGKTLWTGHTADHAFGWDLATGQIVQRFNPHRGWIHAVAASSDGSTVVTAGAHGVRLWDVKTKKPVSGLLWPQCTAGAVAFSPDGRTFLTGHSDGTARLWETASLDRSERILPHPDMVYATAFSPDGKTFATSCWDGKARLWNTATAEPTGKSFQHKFGIHSIAFSPDGRHILTGSVDRTAQLWDVATGERIGKPLEHPAWVVAVAVSPDERTLITGCADGRARFWDASSSSLIGKPVEHQSWVMGVGFSPDGKLAWTHSLDRTVRVWDVATRERLAGPLPHDSWASAPVFTADGSKILTGGPDGGGHYWEARTGRSVEALLPGGDGAARVAGLSPGGHTALVIGWDAHGRLLDVASGKLVGRPIRHAGMLHGQALSPDGKWIVTVSTDRTARLGRIPEPLPGAAADVVLWVQALTGLELTRSGAVRALGAVEWGERFARLQGANPQLAGRR